MNQVVQTELRTVISRAETALAEMFLQMSDDKANSQADLAAYQALYAALQNLRSVADKRKHSGRSRWVIQTAKERGWVNPLEGM